MFTAMKEESGVGVRHTMTVTLSLAISSAKAAEVLEQYGREKVRRREYMREYRKPENKKKANGDGREDSA